MNRNKQVKNWLIVNQDLLALTVLFLGIAVYLSFFGFQNGTDDEWFQRMSHQKDYLTYILNRYMTWSARIFPDSIMYFIFSLPMILYWSITSLAMILSAYSIARFTKKEVKTFDIFLVCTLFGFMNFEMFFHSFLWITGAVNYLWPLALGLCSMIPYADYVFRGNKWEKKSWISLSIICTFLFSISNEQYLIVGFCAALCGHITLLVKKEKQSILLLFKTFIMFMGILFMYFAPGNALRLQMETEKWYPDFNELSVFSHIKVGLNFMVTGIYNNVFSLLLLVILSSILLLNLNRYSFLLISLIIACLSCMYLFPGFSSGLAQIYNYSAKQLFSMEAFSAVMKNFFVAIVLYGVTMLAIYKGASYKIFSLLCMIAALFSIIMLWFSPTLFASGSRVFVCAGVLFLIVAFDLVNKKISESKISKNMLLVMLAIYPIFNLILPLLLGTVERISS
ncbi:hypothetical protein JZO78_04070 [Enterococcus ureilyticus]|uniref:DUF6056 family protein n=1 Tax=Enterococcus ureilyticus TaxID=1131292 RepID=UPI001A938D11|nr:DUF6056 family protein [Enterococcus ureilyticus]MBO0445510.1 hypothetical protein [Enterococcus ureilyticus]